MIFKGCVTNSAPAQRVSWVSAPGLSGPVLINWRDVSNCNQLDEADVVEFEIQRKPNGKIVAVNTRVLTGSEEHSALACMTPSTGWAGGTSRRKH